jgi:hypothetical protein
MDRLMYMAGEINLADMIKREERVRERASTEVN